MSGGQGQGWHPGAPTRQGIPDWVWIIGAAVVAGVVLAVAVLAAGGSVEPHASASSASVAAEAPVTLSGEGDESTDPLTLAGGAYSVTYRFDGSCYYGADLVPIDPGLFDFSEDIGTGDGPVEGDTNVYDVEPGDYYVRVTTGPAPSCPWEITLTGT